jgi:hypothetical protein
MEKLPKYTSIYSINSILRKRNIERAFSQMERNYMKFSRKLIVREGTYGTLSVPKSVIDAWASVETVEMQFDESSNILVVRPIAGDKV